MTLDGLKTQVTQLLVAAVEAVVGAGRELRQVRGTALYDRSKDLLFTSLEPFGVVEASLRESELVNERYGIDQSHRIALQLVYEYFARTKCLPIDSEVVEALWADFVAELDSPIWLTRCITNLRHFHCDDYHVALGDGVSIYGRDPEVLAGLGFHEGIWEKLAADWDNSFAASSFVLVSETSIPKRPDNFIMLDNGSAMLRCMRAIGAMRLVAPGDVGISQTFFQRVARFNVGIGGVISSGSTRSTMGTPYTWSPERRARYEATYTALAHLEQTGYRKARGNLDLALRAFMSTYDRLPTVPDMKLVDAITALEAVLGDETEIAFKLSFRVASLLADSDEQRSTLLKSVKGFYDARSTIVHGDHLKPKHSASLAAVDDLRDMVRRLLRSFVLFTADNTRCVDNELFEKELDAALVNGSRREKLRQLLCLAEPISPDQQPDDRAG